MSRVLEVVDMYALVRIYDVTRTCGEFAHQAADEYGLTSDDELKELGRLWDLIDAAADVWGVTYE